jgi:hypothetical protein
MGKVFGDHDDVADLLSSTTAIALTEFTDQPLSGPGPARRTIVDYTVGDADA